MSAVAYRRRQPVSEPLYQVMASHLETFLTQLRSGDRQLPHHVEHELRAYLECGILAHGFLRVRCEDCGTSRVVAFSCKKRGFCPSCMGRRMADTAARLVEEVLPVAPVRQWVLSFPYEIRYRLAWDGELLSAVLAVFQRVVQGWYRRQAKAQGHPAGRCGAITFVQRFGSSINLNPHVHVLVPDGVYVPDGEGQPQFVPAPRLTDDDVQRIVETTARRVIRLCQRRGLFEEGTVDPYWEQEPLLAQLSAASVQGMVATGERAGRRVRRRLTDPEDGVRTLSAHAMEFAAGKLPRDREAVSSDRSAPSRKAVPLCCQTPRRRPPAAHRRRRNPRLSPENALGRRHHVPTAVPHRVDRETRRARAATAHESDPLPRRLGARRR